MTKYACNNCGAKVKTGEIVGKLGAGFRLEHIECPQCGQQTLSAGERMSVQEAAGIIRRTANESGGGALGNARLIAAAPEMLVALEQVNCLLSNIRSYMPKSIKNRDKYSFELCNAAVNTALAKAKGE